MDRLPAFQYLVPVDENSDTPPELKLELSTNEYTALGIVSAQWSFLEHVLSELSRRLCNRMNFPIPQSLSSLSFKSRLRAFFDISTELKSQGYATFNLFKLHSDIDKASKKRHKLIHGLWDYNSTNPFSISLYSDRAKVAFRAEEDLDSVMKLSSEIAFLNFFMLELEVDGRKISDLPRTGMIYDDDGLPIGYMHRSVMLSPENRERLFPNDHLNQHKNPKNSKV